MTIPDYRAWLIPLLSMVKDGREYRVEQFNDRLADELGLTVEDRNVKTACGRQLMYKNRLVMARSHLIKTGMLRNGGHKMTVVITEQGLEYVRQRS
jgi:restriction system protein